MLVSNQSIKSNVKMRIVLQLVLWVVIGFLAYLVYQSVIGPVEFNKVKTRRYKVAVEHLKDIRNAQLAHQTVTGVFQKDFNKLVTFLDTAQFTLTQRRDSSFTRFNEILKIDEPKDTIVIDTLGYASVKDSLFKKSARYKTMNTVKTDGMTAKIAMNAGHVLKNDLRIQVFEAKISKDDLLNDQDKDLLSQEKETISVDGVNGTHITVGSMEEVKNTVGNWPVSYDSESAK